MLDWYSMNVMLPVPLVIYCLVFLAYMVSQYFTSKYLCRAIMQIRKERAELAKLIQTHSTCCRSETRAGGKGHSHA
jgi:hypothetical protein